MVSTALVLALSSALVYALSNSLQHRAAGQVETGRTAVGLWQGFLSSPGWVVGTVLGGGGLLLHALALGAGEIARVQPFMILGVALAVPTRALLARRRPSGVEMGTVVVAVVGLIVVLVAVEPVSERPLTRGVEVLVVLIGLVALVGVALFAVRLLPRSGRRGFLLALAAGVCFGVNAALMKTITEDLSGGLPGALTHWQAYGFVVMGLVGFGLNQSSYHFAPLAVTLPVLNVVAVLEATVLGMLFFDEVPSYGPLNVFGQLVGFGLLVVALRMTAFVSPDLDRVQADATVRA